MLIQPPDNLLPYVIYDKEKTVIHAENMPDELLPEFLEFREILIQMDKNK